MGSSKTLGAHYLAYAYLYRSLGDERLVRCVSLLITDEYCTSKILQVSHIP